MLIKYRSGDFHILNRHINLLTKLWIATIQLHRERYAIKFYTQQKSHLWLSLMLQLLDKHDKKASYLNSRHDNRMPKR